MLRRVLDVLDSDPYRNLLQVNTRARLRKLASPAYVASKTRLWLFERSEPGLPWITRDAVRLLETYLAPDAAGRRTKRALEWGSGRSTVWLAERCLHLTTVEHNPAWYRLVSKQLEERGVRNVDLRLVDEASYTRAATDLPPETLDLVLVDGLARDEACLTSLPLLRPGGWLMLDNVNWYLPSPSRTPHSRSVAEGPESNQWSSFAAAVGDWETVWTTNGVNDTAVFVRPDL